HGDGGVQPSRFLGPLKALAFRDFRLLWFGHAFQAGTWWAELVTRSIVAYQLTGSALHLGALEFVSTLGYTLLGMAGGIWADRVDRRKLLLVLQGWTLGVYALLTALTFSGQLQIWHLYVALMAISVGEAANQPIRYAAIPSLLPAQYVRPALTLNSMAVAATRVLVPLTTAGLIQVTGAAGAGFALCVLLYAAIMWCTWRLRLPPVELPPERISPLKSLTEGFWYVQRNRNVLAVLFLGIGPLGIGFSYQAILIVYAIAVLGGGQTEFSGLLAAIGMGAIVGGSLLASRTSASGNGITALASGGLYGLMLVCLGLVALAPSGFSLFWIAVPFAMLVGVANTAFRASTNASLLLSSPVSMRGRIMGMTLLPEAVQGLGSLAAGVGAETIGVAPTMAALGIACLLVVTAVFIWRPQIRRL
ncbi:MAG: MFS transporter, partial [Dehalococcoidia bacterium]